MWAYVLRRLAVMVPTLFVVVTLSFGLMKVAPGGPFDLEKKLPPEVLRNLEAKYHLSDPIWKQYGAYVGGLLRGDLGPSIKYGDRSVNEVIAEGLPKSLALAAVALALAIAGGLVAGVVGAVFRGRWPDKLAMGLALGGLCVPNFVLGPLLLLVFALTLQWLPAARLTSWQGLVLPGLTLAGIYVAYIGRMVRAGLVETVSLDFVRTARAKGLRESVVVVRHALPLGLLPVVSFLGPAMVGLITGSVVVEKIFNIPGIGRYFVDAAVNRDVTLAMGIVIVEAVLLLLANLAVDLLYGVLDPRVRMGGSGS